MKKENLQKLCVSAVLVALSTVLSFIKIYQAPLGGSVTLLSMVPICLIGVLYGTKYAIAPSVLYGAIQMLQGGVLGWGLTPAVLIAAILLDYILAFTVMCLSGLWRNKGFWGIIAGTALAVFARFICHFASGVVLWTSFDIFNNPYIYSLVYNGAYMLPELVFTMFGTFALYKTTSIKAINRLVK